MDTPIRQPFLERRRDNLHIARDPLPNGATTFLARSFVKTSGSAPNQILVPCVSGDVVCYGWCPDASHLSTVNPPDALYRDPHAISSVYNYLHWPFSLQDGIFVMNITDASAHVGAANSAPQLSSVTIGQLCYMRTVTVGSNSYQCLDIATASTPFAKIIGIVPGQSLSDYNGLVYAQVLQAVIDAGAGS